MYPGTGHPPSPWVGHDSMTDGPGGLQGAEDWATEPSQWVELDLVSRTTCSSGRAAGWLPPLT